MFFIEKKIIIIKIENKETNILGSFNIKTSTQFWTNPLPLKQKHLCGRPRKEQKDFYNLLVPRVLSGRYCWTTSFTMQRKTNWKQFQQENYWHCSDEVIDLFKVEVCISLFWNCVYAWNLMTCNKFSLYCEGKFVHITHFNKTQCITHIMCIDVTEKLLFRVAYEKTKMYKVKKLLSNLKN